MQASQRASRPLTQGEVALLRSVFADHIDYERVRVFARKWQFFQPRHIAMAPNGHVYFPPPHCEPDFSLESLPLRTRAWFVHEGAHLYQHYGLKWNVILRGAIDRRYTYRLKPGKRFHEYGLEQMGSIAADYYMTREGGVAASGAPFETFEGVLPLT
ncbi:MAG TPA: hypothetical protein VFZ61_12080 [Polyangiales bacterium]